RLLAGGHARPMGRGQRTGPAGADRKPDRQGLRDRKRLLQPAADGVYRHQEPVLMLRATGCGPSVVVCKTCRIAPDVREDDRGERGGALLAAALRMAQADMAKARHIAIEEMPC